MGADHDRLAREGRIRPRQYGHDVGGRPRVAAEPHGELHPRPRERPGRRPEGRVDAGQERGEPLARGRQQRVGRRPRDRRRDQIDRAGGGAERREPVWLGPGARHEQERARPVRPRRPQLLAELPVAGEVGGRERARRIGPARLAAERQHDPAAHLEAGVLVPAEVGRGDPVADEDELAPDRAVGGAADGRPVGSEGEGARRGRGQGEQVALAQADARGNGEGTRVAGGVRGAEAGLPQHGGDVPGRPLVARRPRRPPVHRGRGQDLHLVEQPARGHGRRRRRDHRRGEPGHGDQPERVPHGEYFTPEAGVRGSRAGARRERGPPPTPRA